jgi:hypothetical protein
MGLELFDFLCGLRVLFGITIQTSEMAALRSPSNVIDLVWARIPQGTDEGCLSRRAFYRVRRTVYLVTAAERKKISPDTCFADVATCRMLGEALRVSFANEFKLTKMPAILRTRTRTFLGQAKDLILNLFLGEPFGVSTVRELVMYLVAEAPFSLKEKSDGWSRQEVAEVIRARVLRELCVSYASESNLFAEDLGVTE